MSKRRIAIGMALVLAACLVAGGGNEPTNSRVPMNIEGHAVNPGAAATHHGEWEVLTTFTVATTAPDSAHRTYAAFQEDAAARVYKVDARHNKQVFRCYSTTDGDGSVFLIYGMVGTSDSFTLIGQLTFTTGTMVGPVAGYLFADTVAVASETGSFRTWRAISPTGNEMGFAEVDTGPISYVGIVPLTVTNPCYLAHTGY